jgi:hypothetical protein
MCVATFPSSGVAMLSVASAVSVATISGSSLVTVPIAIAVRAASSGGGVEVPSRAIRVSVARVSGDAPPQPLATRVRARLVSKTQTERGRTTAGGGWKGGPYGAVRTMRSRLKTPEFLPTLGPPSLQGCSCELSQAWVAGVDEVAAGVVRGDRPEGGPDRLHERLMRVGRHRAQPGLELGEGLLDRV